MYSIVAKRICASLFVLLVQGCANLNNFQPSVTKSQQELLIGNWDCERKFTPDVHNVFITHSRWQITQNAMIEKADMAITMTFRNNKDGVGNGVVQFFGVDSYYLTENNQIVWTPIQYDIKLIEVSSNEPGEFIKRIYYPNIVSSYEDGIKEEKEYREKILTLTENNLVLEYSDPANLNHSPTIKSCTRVEKAQK